ncbi:MAG: DNA polymerase IV [Firmicutes bacterium]|uniref:DNA polymerase IV n=1 Tax=Candidatus Onthovivens merdipullorum TaxID=2840889 RepID=A0A9D9GX46_9BACL|nr:DNA polymerase IV [Candidatus Onthovivens merdipullorum]
MSKIILHCDLDAFFCRAEEIKNTSLEGKAFIVGGEGRGGIVSTCSYKAREYGIHSGMPTFQAKMLNRNVLVIPGDYEFYNLLSREFISFLKQYSNKIEQVSIDECFLDLTDYYKLHKGNILDILNSIQKGLYKKTKLKVSIGVGTTKFIAKMASDYKKPLGITIIHNKDIKKYLFPLPVKSFFGIGKKTVPQLNEIGIKTIGDLYNFAIENNSLLVELLGKFTYEIPLYLEGKSSDEIYNEFDDPKSIGMSRTFSFDTNDKNVILQYLNKEIERVVNSLKKEKKVCKTITLTYKNAAYNGDFKSKTFSKSFNEYTQDLSTIKNEAIDFFNKTYDGQVIRLIGFTLKNFQDLHETVTQMTFDNFLTHEKESKTFLLVNELNREFNKNLFKRLSDIEEHENN